MAMLLGAAMLGVAPVIGGKLRIAAAIGLERRFMVLKPVYEGQDRRLILRQAGVADANGRAP
jgi:hypothetical protein